MTKGMKGALVGGVLLALLPVALAQEGNVPPAIEIVAWDVWTDADFVTVYDRDLGIGSRSDIDAYIHQEWDIVFVTLEITDGDWVGDPESENEGYYLRFRALAGSYGPPEAPPIRETDEDFFGVTEDEGFAPPPGETVSWNVIDFLVPQFLGRNQDRLRGFVDYDVLWFLEFSVSNEEAPEEGAFVDSEYVLLQAVENPSLAAPNPPVFADAGPDQMVAAGQEVILDGSRTFDSFNVGFDESDDENIFEKDQLTFTWEWMSGPVRVDPIQTGPGDPIATVVLDIPNDPSDPNNLYYEYRLIVDDNVNALPSTDAVRITVVDELPEKNPPVAIIEGPASARPVGSIITLVSRSYDPDRPDDPDGLLLEYRWQQTDELGGPLDPEDLQDSFQPLSGMTEKVSNWQALTPGTFYFRLLVDDDDFRSSARFAVEVIDTETGGATDTAGGSPSDGGATGENGAGEQDLTGATGCGAGILPLAVAPLAMCALRRRR